jgi:hypothetical protein
MDRRLQPKAPLTNHCQWQSDEGLKKSKTASKNPTHRWKQCLCRNKKSEEKNPPEFLLQFWKRDENFVGNPFPNKRIGIAAKLEKK